MKKFLIFIPFLFLSITSFGFNPTLLSYQSVWLFKKMKSLFQQNSLQANIAVAGDRIVSKKENEEPSLRELDKKWQQRQEIIQNQKELIKNQKEKIEMAKSYSEAAKITFYSISALCVVASICLIRSAFFKD